MNIIKRFLIPSKFKRFLFFLLGDVLIIISSLYLSFLLRFEFVMEAQYRGMIINVLPIFLIIKLSIFWLFRLYNITWRYVGLNDLRNIVGAVITSESILMVLILVPLDFLPFQLLNFQSPVGFPRSVLIIDGGVSLLLLSGLRISKRVFNEVISGRRQKKQGLNTIIIGAGNTGEMIIRHIVKQGFSEFYPVALLDDNRTKIGTYMHGIKVFGTTSELKKAVAKYNAEAVIIAIPSLDHKTLRNIYNLAKDSLVDTIKIVPRIYDFHKPDINLKSLEDIRIEDLIGRQAVEVDYKEIEEFLKDKVILITGGGGSIGSEITMQVCRFYAEKVVLFDIDETELHNVAQRLNQSFPSLFDKISFVVGDIRDIEKVNKVMRTFKPQIIFHAAAYKHVPIMEYNPDEAVKVNIFGTYNMAKAAAEHGVEKFIMISTDKAVRPTSIMGATKRIAENICRTFNEDIRGKKEDRDEKLEAKQTEFISVRFGNVLGSRGSVLPIFLEQLKHGGPLTITHKDMKRYFMTIPEAVSLVLQASVIGKGGDILVLDMGEPVRIVELAEELIKIHGMEPYKDIDLEFIGLRPGEKLFEEILTAEEGTTATKHERVFIARNSEKYSMEEIENMLKKFSDAIYKQPFDDNDTISGLLKQYVKLNERM